MCVKWIQLLKEIIEHLFQFISTFFVAIEDYAHEKRALGRLFEIILRTHSKISFHSDLDSKCSFKSDISTFILVEFSNISRLYAKVFWLSLILLEYFQQ